MSEMVANSAVIESVPQHEAEQTTENMPEYIDPTWDDDALYNLVQQNQDVLVRVEWLGDAVMTVSQAMNSHPGPWTAENEAALIMVVHGLLANRVTEEENTEEDNEDETENPADEQELKNQEPEQAKEQEKKPQEVKIVEQENALVEEARKSNITDNPEKLRLEEVQNDTNSEVIIHETNVAVETAEIQQAAQQKQESPQTAEKNSNSGLTAFEKTANPKPEAEAKPARQSPPTAEAVINLADPEQPKTEVTASETPKVFVQNNIVEQLKTIKSSSESFAVSLQIEREVELEEDIFSKAESGTSIVAEDTQGEDYILLGDITSKEFETADPLQFEESSDNELQDEELTVNLHSLDFETIADSDVPAEFWETIYHVAEESNVKDTRIIDVDSFAVPELIEDEFQADLKEFIASESNEEPRLAIGTDEEIITSEPLQLTETTLNQPEITKHSAELLDAIEELIMTQENGFQATDIEVSEPEPTDEIEALLLELYEELELEVSDEMIAHTYLMIRQNLQTEITESRENATFTSSTHEYIFKPLVGVNNTQIPMQRVACIGKSALSLIAFTYRVNRDYAKVEFAAVA